MMEPEVLEAAEAVRALLSADTVSWRPEPGDEVLGLLKALTRRTTEHSENYPVLTIAPLDGSTWIDVHAFHTVLWDEVEKQDPRVGDLVGVRYIGRVAGGKGGDGYERYRFGAQRLASSSGSPDPAALQDDDGRGSGSVPERSSTPASDSGAPVPEGSPRASTVALGEVHRSALGGEPEPLGGENQWAALLDLCDGNEQIATNRINARNHASYTRQTARAGATWSELEKALEPMQ